MTQLLPEDAQDFIPWVCVCACVNVHVGEHVCGHACVCAYMWVMIEKIPSEGVLGVAIPLPLLVAPQVDQSARSCLGGRAGKLLQMSTLVLM